MMENLHLRDGAAGLFLSAAAPSSRQSVSIRPIRTGNQADAAAGEKKNNAKIEHEAQC